jgi:hypothetical protein
MIYVITPPMTLLCEEIPDFKQFKRLDWVHLRTVSGKSVYIMKRNIAMVEEVTQEKLDKARDEAKKQLEGRKLVTPQFPGSRH